jgi:hypothetical protein
MKNIEGNLKGLSENSFFNQTYDVRTHTMNRFTKNYLYSNILDFDSSTKLEETWDIEVDCPTHSFVANNMIVHNCACTTYHTTGFGSRGCQLWMVGSLSEAKTKSETLIIADGGIREPGDIAKCMALGADLVMVGGMMSGLKDSPGTIVNLDGKDYKEYWGSASAFQSGKNNRIEGVKKLLPLKDKTMLEQMKYVEECLQSAISYGGGNKLEDLKSVDYIIKR